jgi:hypothetical protein
MRYLIELVALGVLVPVVLAYIRRNARAKPRLNREGLQVVRWSFFTRLVSALLFVGLTVTLVVLIFAEHAPIGLCALSVMAASLAGYGALYVWRSRTEYDATTIHSYAMFGKPGQFAMRDFTRAGPVGWRGHEFETRTGDKIYVNSYQTGAADLLDLLQRQAKETYYE